MTWLNAKDAGNITMIMMETKLSCVIHVKIIIKMNK